MPRPAGSLRAMLALALACTLAACGPASAPQPIEVDEVVIYAPLPGSRMSVAYLQLRNNTAQPISVRSVSSPEFGRIEIHESSLSDGVARMRRLEELIVPPRSSLLLEEGGKHLMLMEPAGDLALGQPVSLRIASDVAGEIVVRSPLQSRVRLEADE